MSTVELKIRSGVRNDVSSERFTPNDLLTGKNIDIDETGKTFRRLGRELIAAGQTSSIWSNGQKAFFVRSEALHELHPDMTSSEIEANVATNVAYTNIDRTVYWSDSIKSGRIFENRNARWGLEVPENTFSLTAISGDMPAGTYGVTLVYTRQGMESGAPRGRYIQLAENSGLRIDSIPVPTDPTITGKTLYITRPDGEVFFLSTLLHYSDTSVSLYAPHIDTLPLRTQFKGPAPAGQVVGEYAGRTYVAQGATLFYSQPYEPELFDLRYDFIQFESNITIFAPVDDGVFLATETETSFLAGLDPANFVSKSVLNSGGVLGTMTYPASQQLLKDGIKSKAAMWTSRVGPCLGVSGGQLVVVTGDRYLMPAATRGAALFKIRSGTPQYLSALFN